MEAIGTRQVARATARVIAIALLAFAQNACAQQGALDCMKVLRMPGEQDPWVRLACRRREGKVIR